MVGETHEVENLIGETHQFWILLGVYDDLTSFKPMLDNRTTTWIEGYGQIYGVSSAAGGARHGHVMDFL